MYVDVLEFFQFGANEKGNVLNWILWSVQLSLDYNLGIAHIG